MKNGMKNRDISSVIYILIVLNYFRPKDIFRKIDNHDYKLWLSF